MARAARRKDNGDMSWRLKEIKKAHKRLKKRMKQRELVRGLALALLKRTPTAGMSLH